MKTILFFGLICAIASGVAAETNGYTNGRDLLLYVSTPPAVWKDFAIDSKLEKDLTRRPDLRIHPLAALAGQDPMYGDRYRLDSLLVLGKRESSDYVIVVEIARERLEKRKTFHLPLVFHKYEVYGIIEGELRVVDVTRGRLLSAESFSVEEKGPRQFQATMDDDVNDPDLHLTAVDKLAFFDRLENKASRHLSRRIEVLIGRR